MTELFQNLHACIRVNRLDRAENIIKLMATLVGPSSSEVLSAHAVYIRSLVEDLECLDSPKVQDIIGVQKWFERDMKPTCSPNADVYALMCRAALAIQKGAQRDRTLRRYLVQANKDGLYADTLDSAELTDAQADMLSQVYSGRSADRLLAETQPQDPLHEPSTLSFHRLSTGKNFEIEPVEQKGFGLATLKRSLYYVDHPEATDFPHYEQLTRKQKEDSWAQSRQEALETSVADEALKRWRQEHEQMIKMGIHMALKSKPLSALFWQWHKELELALKQELEGIREALIEPKQHTKGSLVTMRQTHGVYMESLTAEQLSAFTIIQTMRTVATRGVGEPIKLSAVTGALGAMLEHESLLEGRSRMKSRSKIAKGTSPRRPITTNISTVNTVTTSITQTSVSGDLMQHKGEEWPSEAKHWIAAFLVSKLLDVARVPVKSSADDGAIVDEPAMKHELVYKKGRRLGIVTIHEKLREMLTKEPLGGLLGAQLPMVVEPRPWVSYKDGGFLLRPTAVVRTKENSDTQRLYTIAAAEKGDMAQVFEGLNVLGKVPWRINQDVFKVVAEAWNSGDAIADIAPVNPDLPYPPEPEDMTKRFARQMWALQKTAIDNEKSGLHSQRCFQNFQIEIARAYLDETFYCPHNMDFRGRVYPMPPYLNHMGADLARGLMIFAKGKPLGETGLKWLKIHLANVFGYDKASLQEREVFAMEHLSEVYDSVNNPLDGRRWWLQADDPWQCLATCFELKNALESPDPELFVSHMPIHQDGTCNGLQHYAALGGDPLGAQQVNLEPGDRPADIYSAVAQLVTADISKDAETGHAMALKLLGKITRKVVKQTVMTNVYGVTFVGARAQVQKQLDDILPNDSEHPELSNYRLSAYVAHKIFDALGTMFTGAQNIQRWLGQCSDRICTSITPEQLELLARREAGENTEAFGPKISTSLRKFVRRNIGATKLTEEFRSCVVWTTPLKMPVVQPYRSSKVRAVRTTMQDIALREPKVNDAVAKRKQLQAFPPNFIHSLDATHMMLSALKCNELGLTFAAVHDSFWTHATDVPVMNRVLRDAFVLMHSEDIIGRLAAEFKARYKNSLYRAHVYLRSPVGEAIAKLRRGGAACMDLDNKKCMRELLEEHKRQKLLRSKDPSERAEARAMVTPASIFQAAKDADSFQPPVNLGATELGAIHDEVVSDDIDDAKEAGQTDIDSFLTHEPGVQEHQGAKKKHASTSALKNEPIIDFWSPIIFPDVPAKGDFDVRRLRDSQYFFS